MSCMLEAGATHVDTVTRLARAREHCRVTNVSIGTPYLGSTAPPPWTTPSILSPMASGVGLLRRAVVVLSESSPELFPNYLLG